MLVSLSLLIVLAVFSSAMASFVTFTADSLFNAKNFAEAKKHYANLAVKYHNEAAKPETVFYLFGYENTKKAYITRAENNAKVALYCFYMQALCDINLKDLAGAASSVNSALSCFNIQKMLTPKTMSAAQTPEMILISQPSDVIADYGAKINSLPIPAGEVLKTMEKTARERYASEKSLETAPQGPAYDELMAKFLSLVASEKAYAELAINIISRELDAQKFEGFETLVVFMKNYRPIDKSASSTIEISDKIIKKMTMIAISYQGVNIELATVYNTAMQKLISTNAYMKIYLSTGNAK